MERKIEEIITPTMESMNLEIVQVACYSKGERNIIEILLENTDGSSVNIHQCEEASQAISALLDVEDIIDYKYSLEVSSAGLERPLTKIKDYARFTGRNIFVVLNSAKDVEDELLRKFECVILDTDEKNEIINVKKENKTFSIDFNEITRAKLTASEEDIRKILREKKK